MATANKIIEFLVLKHSIIIRIEGLSVRNIVVLLLEKMQLYYIKHPKIYILCDFRNNEIALYVL